MKMLKVKVRSIRLVLTDRGMMVFVGTWDGGQVLLMPVSPLTRGEKTAEQVQKTLQRKTRVRKT